jgi:hypothetical protein
VKLIFLGLILLMVVGLINPVGAISEESDQRHLIGHHVMFLHPRDAGNKMNGGASTYGGIDFWSGDVIDSWYQFVLVKWEDESTHWTNSVYVYQVDGVSR